MNRTKSSLTHHDIVLAVEEVGRVTRVYHGGDETPIPVKRRVGPLPHAAIVPMHGLARVVGDRVRGSAPSQLDSWYPCIQRGATMW
jgi:hypothetical protein